MISIEEMRAAPSKSATKPDLSWANHQREIISRLDVSPALKGYMRQLVRTAEKSLAANGVELCRIGVQSPQERAEFLNGRDCENLVPAYTRPRMDSALVESEFASKS